MNVERRSNHWLEKLPGAETRYVRIHLECDVQGSCIQYIHLELQNIIDNVVTVESNALKTMLVENMYAIMQTTNRLKSGISG